MILHVPQSSIIPIRRDEASHRECESDDVEGQVEGVDVRLISLIITRDRPFRSPTQPQRQSLVYHSILPWAVCLERAEVTMGTTLVAGAPYGPVLPLSFRSLHTPTLDRFITFTSRSRM